MLGLRVYMDMSDLSNQTYFSCKINFSEYIAKAIFSIYQNDSELLKMV